MVLVFTVVILAVLLKIALGLSYKSEARSEINFVKTSPEALSLKGIQRFWSYTVQSNNANKKLHGHRCYTDELTNYEYELVNHLAKSLNPKEFYIFNNITIPSSATITSQIDHIIVSRYGIFVIENKDYKGWIFGNKNQKKWTQVLRGGKKYPFQNPILQNFAHVCSLKEHLPFIKKSLYNVVVFSESCDFKTDMPCNVMHGNELVEYIKSKKNILVSEGELLMVIGKLSMLCQTSQVSNTSHVENLRSTH